MQWQQALWATLTALLASLCPQIVWAGLPGLELVEVTSAYNTTTTKQMIATCPIGKVPVGGGASISGQPTPATIALYQSTVYGTPSTGWRGLARNLEANGTTWELKVQVWCAKQPPGYTIVREVTANDTSDSKAVVPECPSPLVSLAAGFKISGSIDPKLVNSLAASGPATWFVAASELAGSSGTWSLEGAVVCAADPGVQIFTVNTQAGNTDSVQTLWFQAWCPDDTAPLSGGISRGGGDVGITGSYLSPDYYGNPLKGSWHGRMNRFYEPSGGNISVTHNTLCLSLKIFADGFESGALGLWSFVVGGKE